MLSYRHDGEKEIIMKDKIFGLFTYIICKTFYVISIAFVVWFVLSWAEIAFYVSSPDRYPSYCDYNFFVVMGNLFN